MSHASTNPSTWITPRGGWGKIGTDLYRRPCRIAYLGASVTAQHDGYRARLHQRLVAATGQAHHAIQAGIGGVGAITGVFLMDDLVLRHRPELCFVEFSTGDSANDTNAERVGVAAEGILRKLFASGCAVVVLHGPRWEPPGVRRLHEVVRRWEEVAEHYQVASIHLHRRVESRLADDPSLAQRWFRDVVHTTVEGAEFLADSIFESLQHLPAHEFPGRLPPPQHDDHCGATSLVPVTPAMTNDPSACSRGTYRFVYPWLAVTTGSRLTIDSTGDVMGLLLIVGSDAGIVEVETHHGREIISAFDEWCHYDRLHALVWRIPGPTHGITVRLTDHAVDHSICRRPLDASATLPKRLRAIAWMVRHDSTDRTRADGVLASR